MIIRGTRTVRCGEKQATAKYKLFILTDLRCNYCIVVLKVQSLGASVVDPFWVRDHF
jgi:hypothetical protein